MNPLKSIMKPALRLLPWLGLAALTGCSMDDDLGDCTSGTSALQVTVSAQQEGDLNARATEGGQDGEFMHDLCVLFVQDNVVKLMLRPNLSSDASAQEGNLQAWTSGEQNGLEAGTYTVYAFANISDYYDKWSKGGTLSGDALPESIVIEDPAGELNSRTRQYIPMAAKETVEITAATRSVSIGLDRLVSKVRMRIGTTSQDPVTVKNVTFSGYADKVSLIEDASISSIPLRDKKYEYTEEFQISASQDMGIPDFYVNETRERAPFTISVTTTENQGVTYLATTKLDNLPRNSIYPLTLNLKDFGIKITPTAWLKVTGFPYDVYYTPVSKNTYRIEMATGSYFSLTPQSVMAEDGTPISNVSWSWTIPADLPTGYVVASNDNVAEGHFPSGKYYDDFSLQLNAQWTYNGVNYNRAYTFIIDVCHNEVWAMSHRTRNNANSRATDNSNWLIPEFLNMYKIR